MSNGWRQLQRQIRAARGEEDERRDLRTAFALGFVVGVLVMGIAMMVVNL